MKNIFFTVFCIIFATLTTVNADALNEFWGLTCNLISSADLFSGTTCSILKTLYNVNRESNHRQLVQVKPGECAEKTIPDEGYVEVCSSGGFRLYFDPTGYKVRGCYTMGKGNSSSFADCCQISHRRIWTGHAWLEAVGEFCSKPHNNYKNPRDLKVKTITDGQLMKHTDAMTKACKKDWYSKECEEMERRAKRAYTEPITWDGAKQF